MVVETSEKSISAREPIWSREVPGSFWDPPKKLLASIRAYQSYDGKRGPVAAMVRKLAVLRHRFWSVVTSSDIPINCSLGGGLLLTHPNGVVIHPDAVVGPNCLILQQVTLTAGVVIGGHVDIGAGAKILGNVTIGDHCRIGANAVVLQDVPEGCRAVGVPARILETSK